MAASMQAAERARVLAACGVHVISLTLGEPDFPTETHVLAAAHAAALRGETKYPPVRGTAALLDAVAAKFQRDSGLAFGRDQLLVGHGARQIIYDALTATLDPGAEVVIPAPYWNAYPLIARMAGAVPVFVPATAAEKFLPRAEAIEAAITPRTRWLILNFPGNPTGAVAPASLLAEIAEVLRRHPNVWIMCDVIYEQLIFDGSENPCLPVIAPDLAARCLMISGVSKTYAMTGWRVGFAGGPADLIAAMALVQGQSTGGVSPIAQAAAVAALTGPQERVAVMRETYARRSRRMAAALGALPGWRCAAPEAAFYVFADISARGEDDQVFTARLLDEAHVGAVHGTSFGAPGHVRFSTAASDADIEMAIERIAAFCGLGLVKAKLRTD